MIRKHPIIFGLLFFVLILITLFVVRARMPKPLPVRTAQVERVEELSSIVTAPGEIRAHEMVDIQTEIAGVIIDLPVKEGQSVKKGDVLLRIDPIQVTAEVASAKARYTSGESEIMRAEALIMSARSNLVRQSELIKSYEADLEEAQIIHQRDLNAQKRQEDLLKTKTISSEEFEIIEAKARASEQRIKAARARIAQAKADLRSGEMTIEQQKAAKSIAQQDRAASKAILDRAQDQLTKVTIVSPLNGVIAQLNVEAGERAVPGIQSNPQATLMTIANMSVIEAEIKVDESDIIRVEMEQPATIEVDALPDTNLKGKVIEIGSMPIREQNSGNQEGKDFKVVIAITDPPKTLRVGMSCESKITVGTHKNVLAVPIQSLTAREVNVDSKGNYLAPEKPTKRKKAVIQQSANAADGNASKKPKTKELQGVFIKDADNLARFRPVTIGLMGDMKVEIAEGLKEGDAVIVGPLKSQRLLDEWKLIKETAEFEEE